MKEKYNNIIDQWRNKMEITRYVFGGKFEGKIKMIKFWVWCGYVIYTIKGMMRRV